MIFGIHAHLGDLQGPWRTSPTPFQLASSPAWAPAVPSAFSCLHASCPIPGPSPLGNRQRAASDHTPGVDHTPRPCPFHLRDLASSLSFYKSPCFCSCLLMYLFSSQLLGAGGLSVLFVLVPQSPDQRGAHGRHSGNPNSTHEQMRWWASLGPRNGSCPPT